MLLALRNRLLTWLKIAARMIRPRTEGSAPGSPERSLSPYPRMASPMPRRSMSREKLLARSDVPGWPAGAGVPPAPVPASPWVRLVGTVASASAARSLMSDPLVHGRRSQPDVAAAAARDELHDL